MVGFEKNAMKTFEYIFRVPFYDVDSMRVVYHGNYVKYLEEARCAYLEAHGMTYDDMEQTGFLLPMVSLNLKYVRPCVFSQRVVVTVTRDRTNRNLLVLHYRLMDAQTRQICLKAITRQAAVGLTSRALLFELPTSFWTCLEQGGWA